MMKRMILILMIFSFGVSALLPLATPIFASGMGPAEEVHFSIDVCKKMQQSPIKNIETFLVAGFSGYLPVYSVEKGEFDAYECYCPPFIPPRFRPPAAA